MSYYVGVDIGGTKIEVTILAKVESASDFIVQENNFQLITRERFPTKRERGYEAVLNNLGSFIKDLFQKNSLQLSTLAGIGIGMPGSVDPSKNMMGHGNSEIFSQKNISADLNKQLQLDIPIFLENDANLFSFAESYLGVGQEHNVKDTISLGIILGTGCGAGLIYNGNIISGKRGSLAELGHTQLVSGGSKCYCGRLGCAEKYISGTGLGEIYQSITGESISGAEIFKLDTNEKKETISQYKTYLEIFLTNIVNSYDPDYIVLGGGVSNQKEIYKGLEENIRAKAFVKDHPVKILSSKLGDSAGVFGAALLPILHS